MQDPQIVVIGAGGAIGAVHIAAFTLSFKSAFREGFTLAICSSQSRVRDGYLNQGNNLGVVIPEQVPASVWDEVVKYASVEDVLDNLEQVAGVIICTPTDTHVDLALRFNQLGIPVLVEKPIALTTTEIKILLDQMDPSFSISVAQVLPFFPPYAALMVALKSRKHGRVVSAKMHRFVCQSNSINDPANAGSVGNPVKDLGVHDIHTAVTLFGFPTNVLFTEVPTHPEDPSFITRLECELRFSTVNVTLDCGALRDDSVEFAHGFSFKMSDGGRLLMDSVDTNWAAVYENKEGERTPLAIPEFYQRHNCPEAPFIVEQGEWLSGITQVHPVEGLLSLTHAANAVTVLDQVCIWASRGEMASFPPKSMM